jgi:hypothetical protein
MTRDILASHPHLEREDILACLAYARDVMSSERVYRHAHGGEMLLTRGADFAQSAMLAGLFKAPTKFSPMVNLPAARARANVMLDNLVDAGFMTEGQVYGARPS